MLVTKDKLIRLLILIFVTNLLGVIMSQVGFAHQIEEGNNFHQELKELRDQQETMQRELQKIMALLKGRVIRTVPIPKNLHLGMSQEPFKGNAEATVTLIEFTDYQCPFCRKYATQTLPDVEREYLKTGKIKYVVRDFPLQSLHREAFQAAVVADCAGQQGHYWKMHDRLLSVKSSSYGDWGQHAEAIGLNQVQFQNCLKSEQPRQGVQKDLNEGRQVGVRGTPTFFLGISDKNHENVKVLKVLRGAQSFSQIKQSLEQVLAEN